MSYLVLARKWRPKGFEDLVGQEPISRILSNAITQGRIAHAYLFSGPRGVGKTTTARILSKAINCDKGPTPEPCGVCTSCKGITDGSSVDVMEIDGASNNSVDDIRDLREGVKYAPAGGRYKVYIIDEAHMLSGPAFNALLKTLEEPPPHVVFVLATTASRKVPGTVLSRCQHLPFRKIPVHKIKDRLMMISDSEGIKISSAALDMIARASEGSMRDSLTILDQISAFSSDINDSDVKDLLGIADYNMLSGISTAVINGDRKKIIELIVELVDKGTDLKSFAKDLMNFFRDLLVARVVKEPGDVLDISEKEIGFIRDILKTTSEDRLTLLLGEIIKAEADVRTAYSPRVALEMALIKASFLHALTPVKEIIENIESFVHDRAGYTKKNKTTPEKEIPPDFSYSDEKTDATEQTASSGSKVDINEDTGELPRETASAHVVDSEPAANLILDIVESDFWNTAIKKIEEINHLLACKLSEAKAEINGDTVTVTFNGGAAIHADSVKSNQHIVQKVVSDILNKKVSVKIDTTKKKETSKKELKEKILAEPLIQEAIELFNGRLVDVKTNGNPENGGGENV